MAKRSQAAGSSNPPPVSEEITTYPATFTGVFQLEDVDTSILYGRLVTMFKSTEQRPKLSFAQQRAAQVQKEKILNLKLVQKHFVLELKDLLDRERLVPYVTAKPDAFHPHLVADFYARAVIAKDESHFITCVLDQRIQVDPVLPANMYSLRNTGVSVATCKENDKAVMKSHWLRWKKAEVDKEWKSGTPNTQFVNFYKMMCDIEVHMLQCEAGSHSKLSLRKYSVMMALDV